MFTLTVCTNCCLKPQRSDSSRDKAVLLLKQTTASKYNPRSSHDKAAGVFLELFQRVEIQTVSHINRYEGTERLRCVRVREGDAYLPKERTEFRQKNKEQTVEHALKMSIS